MLSKEEKAAILDRAKAIHGGGRAGVAEIRQAAREMGLLEEAQAAGLLGDPSRSLGGGMGARFGGPVQEKGALR